MGKRYDQPLIPVKGPSKAKPGVGGPGNAQPAKAPPPRVDHKPQRTPTGNRRGG